MYEHIPEPKPEQDSTLGGFIKAHEDENIEIDELFKQIKKSHQINSATGNDLERVADRFGDIARRGVRTDDEFRSFIKSIVQAFNGQGTVPGIKLAIAIGVGTSPDNIEIEEDFANLEFEVKIENVDTEFVSSAVNDMAELARPSVVQLGAPPVIIIEGGEIGIDGSDVTVTNETTGLSSGTLTLDGTSQLS